MKDRVNSMTAQPDSEYSHVVAVGERLSAEQTSSSNASSTQEIMLSAFVWPLPSGTRRSSGKSSCGIVLGKLFETLIAENIKLRCWATAKSGSDHVTIQIP